MVRCAKCRHTWIQAPPRPEPKPEHEIPESSLFEDAPPRPRGAKPRERTEPKGRGIVAIGLIIALVLLVSTAAAAVILRDHVMGQWPRSQGLYDLVGLVPSVEEGLKIVDEAFVLDEEGGVTILVISGRIVNESSITMAVPTLEARLQDESDGEITAWTFQANAARLFPGAFAPFQTRFRDPPSETRKVRLTLATE
jgi:hypothetical protein